MRQKSLNENMTSRDKAKKAGMATEILDIDDLLDDEGWDMLNSLTEEELEQLNSDFDPENSLIPVGDRGHHMTSRNAAPMFSKEDLVVGLEKMVEQSKPVIKNEKIRIKEEKKKEEKEAKLKRQYSRDRFLDLPPPPKEIALTQEEEELLNDATEEELIEAAENALHEKQFELREKLLHSIHTRQFKQHNLCSFNDLESFEMLSIGTGSNPVLNMSNPVGYIGSAEEKLIEPIALQFDERSLYNTNYDHILPLYDEHKNKLNIESETETETITDLISENSEVTDFISDSIFSSETESFFSPSSDNLYENAETENEIKLKKVKQMRIHASDKRTKYSKGKETSREYSIDRVRKYNEKVKKYNNKIEEENQATHEPESIKKISKKFKKESSVDKVRRYNEKMKDFLHDNELTSTSSSTSSLSDFNVATSQEDYLPTITDTDEPLESDDSTPAVKVNLNVILNQSNGTVTKLSYSNYPSNCNDNVELLKPVKKSNHKIMDRNDKNDIVNEVEVSVDIQVNIDEQKTNPADIEHDDLVSKMINNIAKHKQKRMISQDSVNADSALNTSTKPKKKSKTVIKETSDLLTEDIVTSTPKNQLRKDRLESESSIGTFSDNKRRSKDDIKIEKQAKIGKSNDTALQSKHQQNSNSNDIRSHSVFLKDVEDNDMSDLGHHINETYVNSKRGQQGNSSYNRDDIFSDSGIDQTSSEMGFTTPVDLHHNTTPSYESDSDVLEYSRNEKSDIDVEKYQQNDFHKRIKEEQSLRKESRENVNTDVPLRPSNRDKKQRPKSGSFSRPRSGSFSRAKRGSSKVKISRDKSCDKNKKQSEKLKGQKSIDSSKIRDDKRARKKSITENKEFNANKIETKSHQKIPSWKKHITSVKNTNQRTSDRNDSLQMVNEPSSRKIDLEKSLSDRTTTDTAPTANISSITDVSIDQSKIDALFLKKQQHRQNINEQKKDAFNKKTTLEMVGAKKFSDKFKLFEKDSKQKPTFYQSCDSKNKVENQYNANRDILQSVDSTLDKEIYRNLKDISNNSAPNVHNPIHVKKTKESRDKEIPNQVLTTKSRDEEMSNQLLTTESRGKEISNRIQMISKSHSGKEDLIQDAEKSRIVNSTNQNDKKVSRSVNLDDKPEKSVNNTLTNGKAYTSQNSKYLVNQKAHQKSYDETDGKITNLSIDLNKESRKKKVQNALVKSKECKSKHPIENKTNTPTSIDKLHERIINTNNTDISEAPTKKASNLLNRLSKLKNDNDNINNSISRNEQSRDNIEPNETNRRHPRKNSYRERKLSRGKSMEKLKHFNERVTEKERAQEQLFPKKLEENENTTSKLAKLLKKDEKQATTKKIEMIDVKESSSRGENKLGAYTIDTDNKTDKLSQNEKSNDSSLKNTDKEHQTKEKISNDNKISKSEVGYSKAASSRYATSQTNSNTTATLSSEPSSNTTATLSSEPSSKYKAERENVTKPALVFDFNNTASESTEITTNYFADRRKARQRRLDVEDYNYETKISAAQQIDLMNLQKLKEQIEKEKEIQDEKEKQPVPKPKEPEPKQINRVKSKSLGNSPLMKRKVIPPVDNGKEAGLKAVEDIRSKLRKVPKPEIKEDSIDDDFQKETMKTELTSAIWKNDEEEKPKKKSALAALLERDQEKYDSKKFIANEAEDKIDVRGVTAGLLQQALLKMNGILTNDQINSVFAGEKPEGSSIKTKTNVKAIKKDLSKIVRPSDEETELDVVALMKHLKGDSDSLFYLCINNQPRLEKNILKAIFDAVELTEKMKHLSLAMCGITDLDVKTLAKSIRRNEQLETLNLESNIITQSGLDALMKVVTRHPSLREIKISNQKQPFGGQGEAMMAEAIDRNENILKFGYSFKQPGPRNKADRAIIRHNENLRQRRRKGEEDVYDLKAVCKIRDPWPQPWIIVKGRRLLGGLLEAKVTEMGHMIDVDNDTRRESRGPKLSQKEAKPLDINALLSARKAKLKGTNIAALEEETDQKNKRILREMYESTKPENEPKEEKEEVPESKQKLGKDIVQLNGHAENKRNKKYEENDEKSLDSGDIEKSPPVSKVEPVENKKKPLGKGLKIASLDDDKPTGIRRRKKKDNESEGGLNFDEFEKEETPKPEENKVAADTDKSLPAPKVEPVENKKRPLGKGSKIASLDDDKPTGRRKKKDEEDEGGINFGEFEKKETPKPEEKKVIGKGVKIASLKDDEPSVPRRRRKKFEDEDEGGLNFDEFKAPNTEQDVKPIVEETKKEETKVEEKQTKHAVEDRKKKLSREGGAKIVADLPTDEFPRRRKTERSFDAEERQKKKEETKDLTPAEVESQKQQLLKKAKGIKSDLPDHAVTRRRRTSNQEDDDEEIDPFANVSKKVSKLASPAEIQRRRIAEKEDEIDPFKSLEERKKKEAKEKAEAEKKAKKEVEDEKKRKLEEQRQKLADIEGRKKKLSLEGGKKVVAAFEPIDNVPKRRRKPKYEEELEENEFLKAEEPKSEEKVEEEVKVEKKEEKEEPPKPDKKTDFASKRRNSIEERKKKFSREGGKKIAALTPIPDAVPMRKRRSKKYDEDEAEALLKEEEEKKKKEEEAKEKEAKEKEQRKKEEEQKKEEEKNKRLIGGKTVAALAPEEKVSLRRRKKNEDEEQKIDPIALVEKTELNAVRVAAKNIKGLPPPDTGISSIRRRRQKDEEVKIDPFASVPEKVEEKKPRDKSPEKKIEKKSEKIPDKKEEKKVDPPKAKKIASLPPPDEGASSIRRRRRRDDDEDKTDPFASVSTTKPEEKKETKNESSNTKSRSTRDKDNDSTGRWFTDEETKSGDRFAESATSENKPEPKKEEEPALDIFAGRDDDGPRLSLRERMAKRGR